MLSMDCVYTTFITSIHTKHVDDESLTHASNQEESPQNGSRIVSNSDNSGYGWGCGVTMISPSYFRPRIAVRAIFFNPGAM